MQCAGRCGIGQVEMSDEPSSASKRSGAEASGGTLVAPVSPRKWATWHMAAALTLGLALGATGGYFGAGTLAGPKRAERETKAGAFIPLAAWTAREGPEHAKVTIIEFSDFQ